MTKEHRERQTGRQGRLVFENRSERTLTLGRFLQSAVRSVLASAGLSGQPSRVAGTRSLLEETHRARVLVTLITVAGCVSDAGPAADARDATSVRTIAALELWSLGSAFGPSETAFVYPLPLRLPNGEIVVADAGTRRIHFFDPNLEHMVSVGGEGDGPGEYRDIAQVWPLGPVSALLFDRVLQRLTVLDVGGQVLRTERLTVPLGTRTIGPLREIHLLADGSLAARATIVASAPPGARLWRDSIALIVFPPSSGLGRLIDVLPGDERYQLMINSVRMVNNHPLGLTAAIGTVGDQILYSGGNGRVRRFTRDGRELPGFGREERGDSVTATTIADLRRAWADRAANAEARSRTEQMLEALEYPSRLPASDRMLVSSGGDVWLRRFRVDPAEPEAWVAYNPAGQLLQEIRFPAGFALAQADSAFFLGVRTTELGTKTVQALPR